MDDNVVLGPRQNAIDSQTFGEAFFKECMTFLMDKQHFKLHAECFSAHEHLQPHTDDDDDKA